MTQYSIVKIKCSLFSLEAPYWVLQVSRISWINGVICVELNESFKIAKFNYCWFKHWCSCSSQSPNKIVLFLYWFINIIFAENLSNFQISWKTKKKKTHIRVSTPVPLGIRRKMVFTIHWITDDFSSKRLHAK